MSQNDIHDRLKTLFVAMFRDNEGERSNAASVFYRFLKSNSIHAKDVDLLIGRNLIERNQQVIGYLEAENKRLAMENAYLRGHVPPKTIRDAAAAGLVNRNQWFDLYDMIVTNWGDPLPSDWRRRIAKLVHVTPSVIERWEAGLLQIPDEALEQLRTRVTIGAVIITERPATRRSPSTKKPSSKRRITINQLEILQGVNDLQGSSINDLSRHLYGEPDNNENLADSISNMLKRQWVSRKSIDAERRKDDRSKWRYYISAIGLQLLKENSLA